MRLLFCNSDKIGSWIIRKLTFSKWSHVAVCINDTEVIEAVWPKVRQTTIHHVIDTHKEYKFAFIHVPHEEKAITFLKNQLGKRYDWRALFGILTPNRDWSREDEWDCAELAASSINRGSAYDLFKDAARVTPQMLYLLSNT